MKSNGIKISLSHHYHYYFLSGFGTFGFPALTYTRSLLSLIFYVLLKAMLVRC